MLVRPPYAPNGLAPPDSPDSLSRSRSRRRAAQWAALILVWVVFAAVMFAFASARRAGAQSYTYGHRYHVQEAPPTPGGGSGGSPDLPASLNATYWWSGSRVGQLYQDAGTTNVSAVGQTVERWTDQVAGLNANVTATDAPAFLSGTGRAVYFYDARFVESGSLSRYNFLHNGDGGTVYLRARYTTVSGDTTSWVATRRSATASHAGINIGQRIQSGNRVVVDYSNGTSSGQVFVTDSGITPGDVVTVAVRFSSTGISISVNGDAFSSEQAYPSTPADVNIEEGLSIGADPNGANAILNGEIYDVVISTSQGTNQSASDFHNFASTSEVGTWSDPSDFSDVASWWDGTDTANMYALQDQSTPVIPNGTLRNWEDRIGGVELLAITGNGSGNVLNRQTGKAIQGADFSEPGLRMETTGVTFPRLGNRTGGGILALVEADATPSVSADAIHNFGAGGAIIRYISDGDWQALDSNDLNQITASARGDSGDGADTDPKTVAASFRTDSLAVYVDRTVTTDDTYVAGDQSGDTGDVLTLGGRATAANLDGVIGQLVIVNREITQEDVNLFHEWTRGLID